MKLEPTGNHLIVRREKSEEMTRGEIVLPSSAQEKPRIGRVLSVGDGVWLDNGRRHTPDVMEGDCVLFSPWAGDEIDVCGEALLVLRETDVLAILR